MERVAQAPAAGLAALRVREAQVTAAAKCRRIVSRVPRGVSAGVTGEESPFKRPEHARDSAGHQRGPNAAHQRGPAGLKAAHRRGRGLHPPCCRPVARGPPLPVLRLSPPPMLLHSMPASVLLCPPPPGCLSPLPPVRSVSTAFPRPSGAAEPPSAAIRWKPSSAHRCGAVCAPATARLGRRDAAIMNKKTLPTSRNFLSTFQTFCPVGFQVAQTVVHFSHFQVQARKRGVWGGVGVFCVRTCLKRGV